ncbi:MAG TPA: GTPase HflX [Polyangiaceae bacterium]|nr:GTPase HflX [Polyangiaceae bacterium]
MPEIYGNTTGLAPSAIKTLEHIYRRKIPLEQVATPELLRSLSDASRQTGRQVGALVHRSGQVDYVVVGDATRLVLPDIGRLRAAEGRFRALRLIHTHLHGEPLTRDDLVDLVRLRLDLVAAVQLAPDGNPRSVVYAYNTPPPSSPPYREAGPFAPHQLEVDFGSLMASLEAEFAKALGGAKVTAKDGRAILIYVGEKGSRRDEDAAERLAELCELARTAGVEIAETVVQLRDRIDPKLVMGKGKLDDVVVLAIEREAETLIFDRDLSPAQISSIGKNTDLKIIDRSQLILDIFAQRAQSSDGKLQVELAQLKYSLPRLGQKDDALSRLTGGIGGRGPGETKLEIGRRRAKERVSHLETKLKTLAKQRQQRRRRRARLDVPVVSIVGYTNAGKSTLLNTLTHSDVLAEDKLFATLDTRSRRLRFPEEREVIITDTVGFIRDLPKELFAAFRATFEEAADADLILHVVDAADPAKTKHIETTEKLLAELELSHIPRMLVFNKIDRVAPATALSLARQYPDSILLCAQNRETTRALLDDVASRLAERWAESATVPPSLDVLGDDGSTADAGEGAIPALPGSGDESLTTLSELLGDSRRRRRRSRLPV